MKKQRTQSYIGTFVNTPEGISSYKLTIRHIRQVVTGGRFVKMFRGNSRTVQRRFVNYRGDLITVRSASSRKEGATHFDVYLLTKNRVSPMFYNYTLKYT